MVSSKLNWPHQAVGKVNGMANPRLSHAGTQPEISLEPGDRFELAGQPTEGRLPLPDYLQANALVVSQLEDAAGHPLAVRKEPGDGVLIVPELTRLRTNPHDTLWLEYREPGRFQLLVEPAPAVPAGTEIKTEQGVTIELDAGDETLIYGPPGHAAALPEFDLALQAARLRTHAGFDRLICLPLVRDMELLEHQIRTAKTVLQRFRGRALLCDEVGLGKTIEAGLIFAELRMRGLIRNALVLVPPSLIEQWQGEMRRKFSLDLVSHDDPLFRQRGTAAWNEFDLIIASLHTAKREPHRSAILSRKRDLVIIDEAHHLRNRNTQVWRFASELQKQYILLLTATPVQNNLDELYNLVTLLEPGLLRTARQFQRRFVDPRDKLAPRNLDELHRLLSEVMVRNRRSTVGLQFTRRWAHTATLTPTSAERDLYENVAGFVRRHLALAGGKKALSRMALIALQMALGSSSQAAANTLQNLAETPDLLDQERQTLTALADQARKLTDSSKVEHLLKLLADYPDKMVVFTQFRATQEMLRDRLEQAGHTVAVFHGGLSRLAKEAAIQQFRGPARLLLATESGSEGRNLQFAHAVCNYDLPWNPMRIEQRIGRLSRIGQTHDISVFNLVAAGTVEAAVLHLLEAKLNLFELVIGEIDMILGNLDEEREFQEVVADLWAESADLTDFCRRMEDLGERLLKAKEAYLEQRSHDDRLFGDRFAPDR
jgi:SNF2 family DNA or RNA helicase